VGQIQIDVEAKSQANVETGLELGDPQRPHGGSKGGLRAAALCGGLSEVCARTEAACRVSEAAQDSMAFDAGVRGRTLWVSRCLFVNTVRVSQLRHVIFEFYDSLSLPKNARGITQHFFM